ncbi:MAG: methylated-DNA--[protein]-cysteine S-methyltransferase [Balneolaceae bacterium]|nr:methylated-DNA--[protein]-cysteine S-methyltransferase [Balneolaceae bacterium]
MDVYHIDSPLGKLTLESRDGRLAAIRYPGGEADNVRDVRGAGVEQSREDRAGDPAPVLRRAAGQLEEYFEGRRTAFNLPLHLAGTDFQRQVWQLLLDIPFGWTVSYGELASRMGDLAKVRAVGAANGSNSLPIVVPCHRVIGTGNRLTGYVGGVERKRWLLQHEGVLLL